jgi:hypothetical protein
MNWTLSKGTWKIPRTKTGDSQTVTLTLEAIEILKARKREASSVFVFPGDGRTGHLIEPKLAGSASLNVPAFKT